LIEQMLDTVHDAQSEHDLLLQLRTVTSYVEQTIKLKGSAQTSASDAGAAPLKRADLNMVYVYDGHGAKRISVVKYLRYALPGFGLKQASELAKSGPWLIGPESDPRAAERANALKELGADVSLRVDTDCVGVRRVEGVSL